MINALKSGITPEKFPKFYTVTIDPYENIKKYWDDPIITNNPNGIKKRPICHIRFLKKNGYSLSEIIKKARSNAGFGLKIEIEVETFQDAVDSVKSGVDIVLLDNMELAEMEKTVTNLRTIGKNILIEASGGINSKNISKYGKTGVDIISVGSITNSVKGIDISLEI